MCVYSYLKTLIIVSIMCVCVYSYLKTLNIVSTLCVYSYLKTLNIVSAMCVCVYIVIWKLSIFLVPCVYVVKGLIHWWIIACSPLHTTYTRDDTSLCNDAMFILLYTTVQTGCLPWHQIHLYITGCMLKHALGPTRPLLGPCSSPLQIYVNTQSFQVPSVRPDRFWATLYLNSALHCNSPVYPTGLSLCKALRPLVSTQLVSYKPQNRSQLTLRPHVTRSSLKTVFTWNVFTR